MRLRRTQRKEVKRRLKLRKELINVLTRTGSFEGASDEARKELDYIIAYGTDIEVED